jgi:hypothetical protein
MTLQLCFDAVAIATIPVVPTAALGYVDVWDEQTGLSNYQSVRERWPSAIVVPITVQGSHALTYDGRRVRMVDMESGDLTATEAAQWCYEEIELGAPSWGEVIPWFMAWWNGEPDLVIPPPPWPVLPTPIGHQYARIGPPPGLYDTSAVLESWLLLPAPPTPYCQAANGLAMADALAAVGLRMGEPPPPQPKEEEMLFVRDPNSGPNDGEICLCSPAGAFNVGNAWTAIKAAYAAAGVPVVLVEDAGLQAAFRAISYHAYTGA